MNVYKKEAKQTKKTNEKRQLVPLRRLLFGISLFFQ